MKIRLIVNPRAAAGRAGRMVPEISRALHRAGLGHEVAETRGPGDATRLARNAQREGADVIAVVGGDGTVNEVSQAYIDPQGQPEPGPDLALIPVGTGGDFRRTFGLTGELGDAVERLRRSDPRPLDLGIVELYDDRGAPLIKSFLNVTSFGVGGKVDRIVNESPKWLGGRIAFLVGSLRGLATYRNAPVEVRVDGEPWYKGRIVNVAIANGRYFGAGMQIAPNADPSDGRFDVVAIGDMSLGDSIRMTPRIYSGKHLELEKVAVTRAQRVEATPVGDEPVLIDLDGEAPGRLPLSARIAPGALRIRI